MDKAFQEANNFYSSAIMQYPVVWGCRCLASFAIRLKPEKNSSGSGCCWLRQWIGERTTTDAFHNEIRGSKLSFSPMHDGVLKHGQKKKSRQDIRAVVLSRAHCFGNRLRKYVSLWAIFASRFNLEDKLHSRCQSFMYFSTYVIVKNKIRALLNESNILSYTAVNYQT